MKINPLILAFLAALASTSTFPAEEKPAPDHRAGSLEKDEPQAVYAADPNDSWNFIFYCLFTRTIKTRLSDDFQEGKPFGTAQQLIGFPKLPISCRVFERIESGDRATEPLYPTFFSGTPLRLLTEPRYSMFKKALEDALGEKTQRPPLARALMQSDVWAAHDLLHVFEGHEKADLLKQVMPLLAQFIKKLSLSKDEIKALPDNYARGRAAHHLPDLFGGESGWMEIRWSKERIHDFASDYRRVSRVFIKPAALPKDKIAFLNRLRQANNFPDRLDAIALVMQNLLIDNKGKVVPTPLTYDVQMRAFVKDRDGKFVRTEAKQFELSRRLLLGGLKTGGFVARDEQSPIYLPSAGNDYTFASEKHTKQFSEPILVRLKTRCMACHTTTGVFTFRKRAENAPLPPLSLLKPSDNDHARYVIEKKLDRKDFKALQRRWNDD